MKKSNIDEINYVGFNSQLNQYFAVNAGWTGFTADLYVANRYNSIISLRKAIQKHIKRLEGYITRYKNEIKNNPNNRAHNYSLNNLITQHKEEIELLKQIEVKKVHYVNICSIEIIR